MDADAISIAQKSLNAAHDGSLSFPEIVGMLAAAGFEGYCVDYRAGSQTFHRLDGDSVVFGLPAAAPARVATVFDAGEIARLVRWAQANPADYSYVAFSDKAKAAGCAGYLVSFPGRRMVYFGRTAETHVEHFPS